MKIPCWTVGVTSSPHLRRYPRGYGRLTHDCLPSPPRRRYPQLASLNTNKGKAVPAPAEVSRGVVGQYIQGHSRSRSGGGLPSLSVRTKRPSPQPPPRRRYPLAAYLEECCSRVVPAPAEVSPTPCDSWGFPDRRPRSSGGVPNSPGLYRLPSPKPRTSGDIPNSGRDKSRPSKPYPPRRRCPLDELAERNFVEAVPAPRRCPQPYVGIQALDYAVPAPAEVFPIIHSLHVD